ncbi:MAG: imidazole glycerol phosphate synthase subunit HisH [Acidimicrobiia bacterium]
MSAADKPIIAVLDYGIGNLRSAQKALEKVGADARLTTDRGLIADAAAVVLPGVGAFGRCMEALRDARLDDVALEAVASGRPFIGICVGMQMMCKASEEDPHAVGLGVFDVTVRWIPDNVKRPQMQWNVLNVEKPSPLFDGLGAEPWMYFVHSFAPEDNADVIATCDYGGRIVAAMARANVFATQFHPEKSSDTGLKLLGNFVKLAAS